MNRYTNTTFTVNAYSWINGFRSAVDIGNVTIDDQNFIPVLKSWLDANFAFSQAKKDISFDSVGNRLKSSRFLIRLRNFGFANHTTAMEFLVGISDSSPIGSRCFHDFFIFADQQNQVVPNLLNNLIIDVVTLMFVTLLFIPKPSCSIWVCLAIISINFGIIGFMSLWGVKVDFASMITIMMSVGFNVDYSAHVSYHYAKDKHLSSKERVRDAMHSVGVPILQSATSSALGVLVLVFVPNYVAVSFVKTIFLSILFGMLHGLFVLPVVLSLFDWNCCRKSKRDQNQQMESPGAVVPFSSSTVGLIKKGDTEVDFNSFGNGNGNHLRNGNGNLLSTGDSSGNFLSSGDSSGNFLKNGDSSGNLLRNRDPSGNLLRNRDPSRNGDHLGDVDQVEMTELNS